MNLQKSMFRFVFSLCLVCLALLLFTGQAAAPQASDQQGGAGAKAWIIPIQGDIEPALTAFVRREAGRALNQGAEILIFEIDTFGGRVDSALQITSFIMSVRNAKTIAWIDNTETSMGVSWSAGALIAFACSEIYMAPGTSMGAAAPVTAGPGGAMEAADEKSVSAIRAQMAALAERNGHPVGLALAMVDYDVELWEVFVDGELTALTLTDLERMERDSRGGTQNIERLGIITPVGKLLSLTAGEALRYGLAADIMESREALLSGLGVTGEVMESAPSVADDIITLLTSGAVQSILILLGLVMIFLEVQNPGFGIPGIVAVIAFLLVFGSSALLGRVGSLEIIIFLIGIGLLAVEIFILPGFGVMGISGILLIGVSLMLSMQDFVIPQFEWEWDLFGRNAMVVFVGLVAAVFGIAVIALIGPKIRIFERLTLKTAITGTAGGPDPDSPAGKALADAAATDHPLSLPIEDSGNLAALAGKIGTTDSVLRPSGRAVIDGEIYSVEADGEFIDEGRGIVVTRVRGNRIIVKRV